MGKMMDILRAMDAHVGNDSGGGAETTMAQITGECSYGLHSACSRASRYEGSTGWQMSLPCECACHNTNTESATGVTCHTCDAVVEPDALAAQTMANGALLWEPPYCRACLLAGLRRLRAELAQPEATGEDGDE